MKKYNYKFPADAYCMGPIEARNKREARAKIREIFGYDTYFCKRLPNGFEIWQVS